MRTTLKIFQALLSTCYHEGVAQEYCYTHVYTCVCIVCMWSLLVNDTNGYNLCKPQAVSSIFTTSPSITESRITHPVLLWTAAASNAGHLSGLSGAQLGWSQVFCPQLTFDQPAVHLKRHFVERFYSEMLSQ